jgi:hypothetical protein
MTTRRLDLDVVGEHGHKEDKYDFMVEEMRRPGNAEGWAEATAAKSPERQERSSQGRDPRDGGRCLIPPWNGRVWGRIAQDGIPIGIKRTDIYGWPGCNPGRTDPVRPMGIGPETRPGWK